MGVCWKITAIWKLAKVCAPRHINLIFEKPLASTYADAKQMQGLAAKYNIRIMTNYQMAWWPTNYAAKRCGPTGVIGRYTDMRGFVGHGGPGSSGVRNKYFFDWLTDPEKNGAGALMDFGCYNALWSIWYLGCLEYGICNGAKRRMRPESDFRKWRIAATLVATYPHAVGVFEGSWDLPRSFQDLEVFGLPSDSGASEQRPGSLYDPGRRGAAQRGKRRTL